MESVESEEKETLKPVIFCNCSRSKCSYHVCRCFVARLYCVDDCTCDNCHNKQDYMDTGHRKSGSSSSAKHKVGCQCMKIKCENTSCKCYMGEVGCSKRCRCEDCANSFGKKPEPMLQGAEYWKARSHKMPNMEEVMSDSTKVGTAVPSMPNRSQKMRNMSEIMSDSTNVGTANQLSPTQAKLTDMNHLTVLTHPGSSAVASLTSHNIGGFQNVSQAESEKGTNVSPKQPCPSKEVSDDIGEAMGDDLNRYYSVIDDISEMLKDDEMLEIANNVIKGMESAAGQPAAATMPCSPTPTTCCNSEDGMNQTEIDNQGDKHDK